MADDLALDELARSDEFSLVPEPTGFEVARAIDAYIPLLRACYLLANQQPYSLPTGYVEIGQVRVDRVEMARAERAEDSPESSVAATSIRNDLAAMEAAIADPEAFGLVVQEAATGAMLVCVRGTQTPEEWFHNFTAIPNPFSLVPGFGLVHLGFELLHRSVRESITNALDAIGENVRVTVVGHSLGAAMGVLAAVDLERNFGRTNVDVATFGGPRVGKVRFRRNFNREIPLCYRVVNLGDIVPHVPSVVTAWNHVGEEIEVDGRHENEHSLEAYLAGLRDLGMFRELSPAGERMALDRVVSLRVP